MCFRAFRVDWDTLIFFFFENVREREARGSEATKDVSPKREARVSEVTENASAKHEARGSEATENASAKPEGAKRPRMRVAPQG